MSKKHNRTEAQKQAGKKYDEKRAGTRFKSWTCIVYPDSAPCNWRDIINAEHVQWVESPLHDKDINEGDEQQKKPHWHVLLLFDTVKNVGQIQAITEQLGGTIPIPAKSAKGLVRYMLHLDNPDKHQYPRSELKAYGGVDLDELLRPSSSDRYQRIGEMMDFVDENDITEMHQLLKYAKQKRFDDWFPLLCDNSAYILGQYIKSCRHGKELTAHKEYKAKADRLNDENKALRSRIGEVQ